ncbi:MAG: arcB 2, partial [Gammaproteobacteria bacterium]|nr:arcB 2 [Gammaproteobacteria bacterium]
KFTLNYILSHLPVHIYWKDKEGKYLGANDQQAISVGYKQGSDLVGKTDFDFAPTKEEASLFRANDLEVMQKDVTIVTEELGTFNGKPATVLSSKGPLRNTLGEISGILGLSIDITDRKKTEQLRLENAFQKIAAHEKFVKITEQVSHDIRSPLATLLMVLKTQEKVIPEKVRMTLRQAATAINDIANGLLSKYQKNTRATTKADQNPQFIFVYLLLQHVLSNKQLEYKQLPIGSNYRPRYGIRDAARSDQQNHE